MGFQKFVAGQDIAIAYLDQEDLETRTKSLDLVKETQIVSMADL